MNMYLYIYEQTYKELAYMIMEIGKVLTVHLVLGSSVHLKDKKTKSRQGSSIDSYI